MTWRAKVWMGRQVSRQERTGAGELRWFKTCIPCSQGHELLNWTKAPACLWVSSTQILSVLANEFIRSALAHHATVGGSCTWVSPGWRQSFLHILKHERSLDGHNIPVPPSSSAQHVVVVSCPELHFPFRASDRETLSVISLNLGNLSSYSPG